MFVGGGTSSGGSISHYNASGTLVDSLSTGVTYQVTGMCFNSVGDLYATNFSNFSATRFDDSGHILQNPWVSIFTGRFESCVVDRFGNVYLSRVDSVGGNQLTKYDPSGALLGTWTPAGENRGIDWVDLSGDQCTMLYTSEGGTVKAFNVCTGTQLADFATGLGGPCYQLRIRPNGEVLVACAFKIVRLSTTGSVLQTYLASTYGETNQFALSIDPTDTVMWTGDLTSADVLKIDIASGAQLLKFTNAQGAGIGVAVYGSPSAGIPVGPPPGAPPPEATYGPCDQASRWWQNSERVRAACRAAANDPVNLATGAVSSSMTDASLPSIGELFKFTRSYTSLDTNTGELGAGWTDNYADRLTIVTGLITWRSGSGAQVVFTQQPDTTYKAPVWTTATLTASGGGYEAVTPGQTHYTFDSQGRLTGVKDRNAKGVTLAYDAQGLRSTLTDSAGRVVTFSHNADGTLSRITLPDSRFVQYGYTSGRLTTVTDLRSGTYTYGYDTAGRLQSETDQNLHRLVFNTYGPDGRISQQLDGNNNPTLFAWDAPSQTATVTDARLNQWKSVFNGTLLVSQTDPLGGKVRYGYDPGTGDLTLYVDALGQAEQMSYDSRHNRLTRTAPAPLSYKETWTYNTFNDSLSYKDGRLNQTDYGYDTAGNLTTVQGPDPDGGGVLGRPLTTYTRDPAGTGLIVAKIDPRQKTTQYAYDPTTHALSQITTPLGEKTTFTYEANSGRLKTSVEPRGNVTGGNPADYTTSYTYDNADHLITLTSDPDGGGPQLPLVKQWLYDPAGNLQTLTDENTHATDYGYDPANHLMTVTAPDPDGGGPLLRPVTSYTYDEVGNLKTRSVAAGTHTTTYMYDSANRLQSVSSPTNQLWTYTYDADGNRVTQIDPNGNSTPTVGDGKTTYGYDALGRLSTISYSDTTPAVSFLYDANGNRTQLSDGSPFGADSYAYDALNNLTTVTRGSNTFSYVYDIASNIMQTTYPDSTAVAAAYDNDERLASITSGNVTTGYQYDPASNLKITTLPSGNGFVETRSYDNAGRLFEVKNAKGATTLSDITYTLDPAGNPTKSVRSGGSSETDTYTYDNLSRLTKACFQLSCPNSSDPAVSWTYSDVGNRLTETRPSTSKTY